MYAVTVHNDKLHLEQAAQTTSNFATWKEADEFAEKFRGAGGVKSVHIIDASNGVEVSEDPDGESQRPQTAQEIVDRVREEHPEEFAKEEAKLKAEAKAS